MSVRVLGPDDTEAFIALRVEGIDLFPDAFMLTRAEAEQAAPGKIADWLDQGECFGHFTGDRLTGFAAMAQRPWATAKHRANIGPYYVTPDQQGKSAAQALMDAMVTQAGALGVVQLELWVWSGNPCAIRFYTRNGFAHMGTMPRAVIVSGQDRDDFFFVRHLDR